jgi:proline iminopeptidase
VFANLRGARIYYDIDGMSHVPQKDGSLLERPALFMVHGGPGGDHVAFKKHSESLREVAQLVYIDHRGCGLSTPCDPATMTMDHNIDDLDALREQLGVERIAILGSSYGGMVAQGYAIRYPHRVSNLILSVTAPSFRFIEDARRILKERGTPEQNAAAQRLWDGSFENDEQQREFFRQLGPMYTSKFKPEDFDREWNNRRPNFVALNMGFGGFLRTFDYTDQLHTIRCPTLVLAGALDWICPPNHSRLIAERIPRAHLKVLAHSSHGVALDEPEAYLAAIKGFLTYAPV